MPEIEVLQVPSELDKMMTLFRERKPKRILEIGSWDGGTIREWLTNAPAKATVVAVDLDHRNREEYETWRDPDTTLALFTGESQSAEAVEFMQIHGPYDWALIDGDHTDAGVRADLANVRPLIRKGGLMILHDVALGAAGEGDDAPRRVLEELREEGLKITEFVEEPYEWNWAHGIGVVQL